MAYSRPTALGRRPDGAALTADMVGIGMNFAAEPDAEAQIEATLVHASEVGMVEHDLRVLSVLTTWLDIHHRHVNVDRLRRAVSEAPEERVRAYWAAVATWLGKDRRFAPLLRLYRGHPQPILPSGTDYQLARRGHDERFRDSSLLVPAGVLRDRPADVLSPEALVNQHAGYRNRVLLGPTWRADVWTVLERMPDRPVAEVARRAGSSFATAWETAQDFTLLGAAASGRR